MREYHFRPSLACDLPQLKSLWACVFADPPPLTDGFFSLFGSPGTAMTAFSGDRLCCAFHLMEGFSFLSAGRAVPCTYLYALATHPDFRGQGLGKTVTRLAARLARERGAELVTLKPTGPSLALWYQRAVGAQPVFSCRTLTARPDGSPFQGTCTPLSPEEYGLLRERLLGAYPHISIPPAALALQQVYSSHARGGLLRVELDGVVGCTAAEIQGDTLLLRELLFPEGEVSRALTLLLRHFSLSAVRAVMPAFSCTDARDAAPQVLLLPESNSLPSCAHSPFWGLCFE